ncbi:DUF2079 domain-containing protein [Solidesulfovibrio sp. C21]|uniref:DUF2079 domain-containing protein n=1 Tax=Solidesulfovibrio sp. C21 TaxID=3398613 RepID=UPI0039FD852E
MSNLHAPATLPVGSNRGFGGAVFLGLFAVLAFMACFKYLALHSTVFDLGVFLSNLYSLHRYGEWWRAFLGHAQPLLPLYAQVYRLVPDQAAPLVLLTVQGLVLALPALMAARRYGMLAALAYALYFPVWTNALFDFHLDHLLIPILFAFLVAATSGRPRLAFVLGLLPCLVKEPYALTTIFCGAYLAFVAGERKPGWWLMLFGALYFYVATAWIVPYCTADGGLGAASGGYAWLGGGPGAAFATCLLHPLTVLGEMFGVAGKWKYLGFLFGALLFFPLFRPKFLLPAVPALALALLSTQPNYYGWANHYTAGAAGALFFAFCEVLGPVRILARQSGIGVRQFGLVLFTALAVGHVLLAPSPVSRLFWATDNFAFSMEAYEPTARDAAILSEILKAVPRDPDMPVVAQNTLNWGALAERLDYNSFPLGVFTPHPVRDLSKASLGDFWKFVRTGKTDLPVRSWQAQYVLLDLTRPWFVLDKGCEFQNGACRDKDVAREFSALVDRAKAELETVYDQGGFLILRRHQPKPAPAPAAPTAAPQPAGEAPAGPAGSPTPEAGQTPTATPGTPPQAPSAVPGTMAPGTAPAGQTPPATTPMPAAPPAPGAVAPASPGEVEVEVLDRFPTQHSRKKAKPAVETPGASQPDAAATVTPEAPATDTPQPAREPRRARRHRDATGTPAPTTPTENGGVAPDATSAVSPDAATTPTEAPAKKPRRVRRHREATEIPAPTPTPATGGDNAVPTP